ncbi:hypothetical protein KKI23_00500 [Patescibacteria group bacterium]|nr:hypothetical protein [Patescibacteria group bacterium]
MERSFWYRRKWPIVSLTFVVSQAFCLTTELVLIVADVVVLVGAVCYFLGSRRQPETALEEG